MGDLLNIFINTNAQGFLTLEELGELILIFLSVNQIKANARFKSVLKVFTKEIEDKNNLRKCSLLGQSP